MKLTIEQKTLSATLKRLSGIVESRNTLAILGNVAMTAHGDNTVTLRVSDLDIEATATIAAQVDAPGATTIPARTLADIVGKLPSGSVVSIALEGHSATLSAGRSSFTLATLPIEDFPALASDTFDHVFDVDATTLGQMIGDTLFAASTEEMKYYLNGPYLHSVDGCLVAVATDGQKLAHAATDIASEAPGIIIPRKTAGEIVKSFVDGVATVHISQTKIKVASTGFTILSKVIDGTFPDYTRVIPRNHPNTASFAVYDMKAAVERVVAIASDKTRAVKVTSANGEITVSSRSASQSATDAIAATITGNDANLGFNGGYMLEILRQMQGNATMHYNGPDNPVVFRDGGQAFYLLMPMRVA